MSSKILAVLAKNSKSLLAVFLISIAMAGYFGADISLEILYKEFHLIFKVN